MTDYTIAIVVIGAFCLGLLTGIGAIYFGFQLGFKASYEIRESGDTTDKGLFSKSGEPAEFDLDDGIKIDD